MDEDYAWLNQNAFAKNPKVFPANVFGPEDFRWAVGLALSRSFFVNGELRLTPLIDFANHSSSRVVKEPTGARLCFASVFGIVRYVLLCMLRVLLWSEKIAYIVVSLLRQVSRALLLSVTVG